MVKSKFPGKPSKLINRKIVASSKHDLLTENESTIAAENTFLGLSVFNGFFGDQKQVLSPFHGFSPHEFKRAKRNVDNIQEEIVKMEDEANERQQTSKEEELIKAPSPEVISPLQSTQSIGVVNQHATTRAQCQELRKSFADVERSHLRNVNKRVANRLLQKAKKSSVDMSALMKAQTSGGESSEKTAAGVLKFVLPHRSARSSRVIKPNKRFIDSDENKEEVLREKGASVSPQQQPRTIKLKKPRLILSDNNEYDSTKGGTFRSDPSSNSVVSFSTFSNKSEGSMGSHELGFNKLNNIRLSDFNVFGAPISNLGLSPRDRKSGEIVFPSNLLALPGSSKGSDTPVSPKSKVILRESKLNLALQEDSLKNTSELSRSNKTDSKSSGFSVKCDFCGAIRFYRFLKNAKKFGVITCETCRKCITAIVLKAESNCSVDCIKGRGKCLLSFVNLKSKAPNCWACFVLLCVKKCERMPQDKKENLIGILPPYMRPELLAKDNNTTTSASNVAPRFSRGDDSERGSLVRSSSNISPLGRVRRKAAMVALAANLRRINTPTAVMASQPSMSGRGSNSSSITKLKKLKMSKGNLPEVGRKFALKKGANIGDRGLMRQRNTMKGPRVKHVCRSASIVLGQPPAIFPWKPTTSTFSDFASHAVTESLYTEEPHTEQSAHDVLNTKDAKITKDSPKSSETSASSSSAKSNNNLQEKRSKTSLESALVPSEFVNSLHSSNVFHSNNIRRKVPKLPAPKKGQRRTLQDLGVYKTPVNLQANLISLDFWETYDPDEIGLNGYGLIGANPFSFKAMCFLCGSAGKDNLIHCASCCEPYHTFCVDTGVVSKPDSQIETWRVDWVCPRCTVCHGCGRATGNQLVTCQKCHCPYHIHCLGPTALKINAGERPGVCSSCLRCKSCNSTDVSKFVANLPFCKLCFKLRQKGNFCPLCQGCYAIDDYQSKMMECVKCNSWVHASCEGLSDEKYQVLSYLPESVEYVCKMCCRKPPTQWSLAVEAELQAGYLNIVKAITKNRKACALLKWSPRKTCSCQPSVDEHENDIPVKEYGKRRLFEVQNQTVQKSSSRLRSSAVFDFNEECGESAPISKYTRCKEKMDQVGHGQDDVQMDLYSEAMDQQDKLQFSPSAGCQSDSGLGSTDDELKACSTFEEENENQCSCSSRELKNSTSLLAITKKARANEYFSVGDFHWDMDQLISDAESLELREFYVFTLKEVFPWFDPKCARTSSGWRDGMVMSPCKPSQGSLLTYQSKNSSSDSSNSKKNVSAADILRELLPPGINGTRDSYFYSGSNYLDNRMCALCKLFGDTAGSEEGRLLYCGVNEWVHANCALWSGEVFEEFDGALQNVGSAMSRGRMIKCRQCGKKGASIGCCAKKCEETLHFPCARKIGFVFMEDKNVYCPQHRNNAPGKPITLDSGFDISRPVYIELDRRKKKCVERQDARLLVGSLMVENLGSIVPGLSDQGSTLVPSEFLCTRWFWSSKEPWRIVEYTIRTFVRIPSVEPVVDTGFHVTVDHSKDESTDDKQKNAISKAGPESDKLRTTDAADLQLTENSVKVESCSAEDDDTESTVKTELESDKLSTIVEDKEMMESSVKAESCCAVDDTESTVKAVMDQILDQICNREAEEETSDPQNSADLLPPELKDAIFDDLPHDLIDGISMQDIFEDKFLTFEDVAKDEACDDGGHSENSQGSTGIKPQLKFLKNARAARQLKRSKSDVMPSQSCQKVTRLQQRSCSLAWSCKLGASVSHCIPSRLSSEKMDRTQLIQELRLSVQSLGPGDKGKENQSMPWQKLMQVDGADDTSHDEELDMAGSQLSLKLNNEREKQSRRQLSYRGYRIAQLDGTVDFVSNTDSNDSEEPVRCSLCRRTYRTKVSLERHLPTCSGDYSLSSSDSEAEASEDESMDKQEAHADEVHNDDNDHAKEEENNVPANLNDTEALVDSQESSSITVPLMASSPDIENTPSLAMNTMTTAAAVASFTSSALAASEELNSEATHFVENPTPELSVLNHVQCTTENSNFIATEVSVRKHVVKESQSSIHEQIYNQHHVFEQTVQQSVQTIQQPASTPMTMTMIDYQQVQQSNPTVLLPSVQSYVEAFQQQTGQTLQYMTTLDGGSKFVQAIPVPIMAGAYQLQPLSESVCVDARNIGIPTIPPVQVPQPQAPMLSTVVPSPIYNTLQVYQNQTGGMIVTPHLTPQPVTVVSNTYMSLSTSQFVQSTVPGVLGNNAFTSTSTQVYQPNKLDTGVSAQYSVINPSVTLAKQNNVTERVVTVSQAPTVNSTSTINRAPVRAVSTNLTEPVSAAVTPPSPQTSPVVSKTRLPQRTYSNPTKKKYLMIRLNRLPEQTNAAVPAIQIDLPKNTYNKNENIVTRRADLPAKINGSMEVIRLKDANTKTNTAPTQSINLPDSLEITTNSDSFQYVNGVSLSSASNVCAMPTIIASSNSASNVPAKPSIIASSNSASNVPAKPSIIASSNSASNVPAKPTIIASSNSTSNVPAKPSIIVSSNSAPNVSSAPTLYVPSSSTSNVSLNAMTSNSTCNVPPKSKPNDVPAFCVAPNTISCASSNSTPTLSSSSTSDVSSNFTFKLPTTILKTSEREGNVLVAKISAPSAQSNPRSPLVTYSYRSLSPVNQKIALSSSQPTPPGSLRLNEPSCTPRAKFAVKPQTEMPRKTQPRILSSVPPKRMSSSSSLTVKSNSDSNNSSCASKTIVLSCPNVLTDSSESKNTSVSPVSVSPAPRTSVSPMNNSKMNPFVKLFDMRHEKEYAKCLKGVTPKSSPLKAVNGEILDTKAIKSETPNNVPKSDLCNLECVVPLTVLQPSSPNIDSNKKNCVFNKEARVVLGRNEISGSPLKLRVQKQSETGCYKIISNDAPKPGDGLMQVVKIADIHIVNNNNVKEKKYTKSVIKGPDENVNPIENNQNNQQNNGPGILFEMKSKDGFSCISHSLEEICQTVFVDVQKARSKYKLPPLKHNPFSSQETACNFLGLNNKNLKYLLEQLPLVESCKKYRPTYHKSRLPGTDFDNQSEEDEFKENPSGCARTEPWLSAKKYDMFSWLDSRHRRLRNLKVDIPNSKEKSDMDTAANKRAAILNLPMAMRFRHLKETSKTSVLVYRSGIHGRGLFCLRDIEAGEMVIEYAGEVIRNALTDIRERYYQSKGIGCYMFKIDESFTVDATRRGNAARFINHSCEPNCYSRVVDILGKKHILIFAFRRISLGEELTYDYKFPIEDEKISCHCLAKRCRKYLN